ncbi:hypothetical protein HBI56_056370 [Parastagonospora nodorum]|uniref:Uncharacterized protein n=1 Tax=Phaeosphaeria nodorum (strain SN15 / ATCC MYA-4574 / FGSC 10173) TaxID=321614 RepID=A0A7U2NQW2_PHANO|nr:hypothetical protein HBH56_095740 [Parastagonospora nodorum]QRD07187.1 hypothetical protein JI435_308380 [Parastagonospora nodorum SN15]KAH3930261.1 hypothetical protein HBH54_110060 [Parastagonospora nodorum]KAH3966859.1 hypothetical protein HBH51_140780 [Parastagonospora nodorum]KAH3981119.1 hypothetical protein HBH52_083510 [Parastagonospora nodorum]
MSIEYQQGLRLPVPTTWSRIQARTRASHRGCQLQHTAWPEPSYCEIERIRLYNTYSMAMGTWRIYRSGRSMSVDTSTGGCRGTAGASGVAAGANDISTSSITCLMGEKITPPRMSSTTTTPQLQSASHFRRIPSTLRSAKNIR